MVSSLSGHPKLTGVIDREENPFESYMWFLSENLEGINLKPSQRSSEDTNLDGSKISGLTKRSQQFFWGPIETRGHT